MPAENVFSKTVPEKARIWQAEKAETYSGEALRCMTSEDTGHIWPSEIQKYPPRLPVKQEVQNGVELTKSSGEPSIAAYDEEYDEEYDEHYDEVAMQSDNLVSFEFPQHQKFEIPEEFRTFLNTPPKWINIENW